MRSILDEGPRVIDLLARLQDSGEMDGPDADYLAALLTAAARPAREAEPAANGRAAAEATRTSLTPRELEILHLAAQAMTNKRIALTLNITFGTVKWNVKNILAKLGVSSRFAAIATARQQGLLK
ncbi:transcriptional regulator EpsA [compost metagenome]